MHDLRSESSSQSRRERINRTVYYNVDVDEDAPSSMSVNDEGVDEHRVPDEDMPAVSSSSISSGGRSKIVADYEGRIQRLEEQHQAELRFKELQEAKK